ncbi:hypothetical protein RhiJN_13875 [Ceratobasidium sp. AG-Ba]|nr:hypothetical protein RhiJN_13875 [Ceratobasidium sp. AG-Ba]QRW14434.1 hypothetical protein RhiLY_13433 [Ceratobasidium sp. AG-Ba]
MARTNIATPKISRIDARQRYEPKSRSSISTFARTVVNGTPTRHVTRGTAESKAGASVTRWRALKRSEDTNAVGRCGAKHFQSTGRAGLTDPLGRMRGVSSLWKSGLDLANTRHLAGGSHAGEDIDEDEGNGDDEHSGEEALLLEASDVEWRDERTLIDDLMGFDDETQQNKLKRQEALAESLREHFASLSVSIKQDLVDAVVPVIDNLASTITLLQKADEDYKQVSIVIVLVCCLPYPRNGITAFDDAANDHLSTLHDANEEFSKLKDQSLARLKHITAMVEDERNRRAELCQSFKARYAEICSAAEGRLTRLVSQDIEQAVLDIENRGNAIVNGKDKNKEKMRQQILKAFA